ncbi:hypothetical protein CRYUN_Cryun10bG0023200 [Craigia yunnanensis]
MVVCSTCQRPKNKGRIGATAAVLALFFIIFFSASLPFFVTVVNHPLTAKFHKTATEKRKWEPFRHKRRRYESGFSDSIPSLGPGISYTLPPLKPKLTRRKSKRIRDDVVLQLCSTLDAELCYFKSTWKNFSLSELQEATNNFSHEESLIGGGYAEVYKGQLKSGNIVAIKRLTRGSPEEMTMDFLSELGIIVHVDHPNIAKLIGYGVEKEMDLVLQLSPHGSLASLLYGPKEKLNWCIRFKIAVGAAEGLSYLHEGCQRRIIHKDIKASNILLTEDFDAQISDFGLAKWLPDQRTHHIVSKVEGTFGCVNFESHLVSEPLKFFLS